MPTEAKERTVARTKEICESSVGMIFTDYRGLSVKSISQLRRELKGAGAEYHVVKNTLFRLAYAEKVSEIPPEYLEGPTAIAFVKADEAASAKLLADFMKEHPELQFKGAYISGRVYSDEELVRLSKLPPKDVLLGQIVGLVAAPVTGIAGIVNECVAQVVRCVAAIEQQKSGEAA
jgi:large subunit ribosomal protein L10